MEAASPRPRFSLAVHTYLYLFFILLGFVPIFLTNAVANRVPLPTVFSIASSIWPVLIAILFLYARRRCSGDNMTLRDGLLWVTASMMTGWSTLSFATVFPSLAVAFFGSVFVALASDLRRDPQYATQNWLLIVRFFYRHRRQ